MANTFSNASLAATVASLEAAGGVTIGGKALHPLDYANLTGLYASRPVATTVDAGTIYYATDVPEAYRSDGATWTVLPCGGTELAYAQITSTFTSASTTFVDVTGLSVTCVVGERPVAVIFNGMFGGTVAGAVVRMNIHGNVTGDFWVQRVVALASADNSGVYYRYRASGLTPGSTQTWKMQAAVPSGGGNVQLYAAGGQYPSIQVVTL